MTFFSRRKSQIKPIFQSHRLPRRQGADALDHLVIFLGHHKVGSTALQDHFARNAAEYARQGVLYPFVDFQGAAHVAASAAGSIDVSKLPLNVREPHNALGFAMLAESGSRKIPEFHQNLPALAQMRHAIAQQMAFLKPNSMVLISEVFANFGAENQDLIRDLAQRFPARRVTLYAAFRRIDSYLVAWHGQRLKFGHQIGSLQGGAVDAYRDTIHFDFRKVLDGWQSAFPDARLCLRSYDEVLASGGLAQDVHRQVHLPGRALDDASAWMNTSLHPALQEILRRAVAELSVRDAQQLRRMLTRPIRHLELPDPDQIEMFGRDQRQSIAADFRDIDHALARHVARDRFFPQTPPIAEPRPVPEADANTAALHQLCEDLSWCKNAQTRAFLLSLRAEFNA